MKQTSDTSFEADWLSLREPADHTARDSGLLARAAALAGDGMVLDLGAGTGSTARAFLGAGANRATWRFFDHDPALLRLTQTYFSDAECVVGDMADVDALPLDGVALITASALFDLMSEAWVTALLDRAERVALPIYAALNYNGAMHWSPTDPRDAEVTKAFNTHQRRDKGTGPALGPAAATTFAQKAGKRGWDVAMADSPWQLGPQHTGLHRKLVAGIADAAHEAGAPDALGWAETRQAMADTATAVIGHHDVLAIPGGK